MIIYTTKSVFDTNADVLCNPVNCKGVSGAGLTKEFADRYPAMAAQHKRYCEQGHIEIGKLWMYDANDGKRVLCFPTKDDYRKPSKTTYIEAGLRKLADSYQARQIASIALPMLGCGLGKLDFVTQVKPLIERYLEDLPMDVYVSLHGWQAVAVVGSRDYPAPEHVERFVSSIAMAQPETLIISGGARGVDTVAANTARANGLPVRVHPADWQKHGKSAGMIRNEDIIWEASTLVAFWDGVSSGTENAIERAVAAGIPVTIVDTDGSQRQLDNQAVAPAQRRLLDTDTTYSEYTVEGKKAVKGDWRASLRKSEAYWTPERFERIKNGMAALCDVYVYDRKGKQVGTHAHVFVRYQGDFALLSVNTKTGQQACAYYASLDTETRLAMVQHTKRFLESTWIALHKFVIDEQAFLSKSA